MVIAIDGYSSCGKSTVAKTLAKKMGFVYIDTGAMYRALTLFCIENDIVDKNKNINIDKLSSALDSINIDFLNKDNSVFTILNEINVEEKIRGIEVSSLVSEVSKIKIVREKLVSMQKKIAADKNVILDGRDIGTVVFPNADYKFFMTADPDVRAKRRFDELIEKGQKVDFHEIKRNIIERDFQDENRTESPLKKASDAIVLDNTHMTREEQIEWIIDRVKESKA